jgi:hypothetical protein
MKLLRDRKHRILISLLAGMTAVTLIQPRQEPVFAWWGALYPRFCYEKTQDCEIHPIKISFWLAKALNW